VVTSDHYIRNRLDGEPYPSRSAHEPAGGLVIYRDSDIDQNFLLSNSQHRFGDAGLVRNTVVPDLSCSHDRLAFNRDRQNHPILRLGVVFQPNVLLSSGTEIAFYSFIDDIGSSHGCPKQQQIVRFSHFIRCCPGLRDPSKLYMGVAADCDYVFHYGSAQNATANILKNWNVVSSLYKVRVLKHLHPCLDYLIVSTHNVSLSPPSMCRLAS
jgi:hypothetical protein